MLVILGSRLACTFTSEQQSTPAAEEDGVSVTVTQVTAVLHGGEPCLAVPVASSAQGDAV